jgi:3-deoxy-7-phosphoheptulonate synthase
LSRLQNVNVDAFERLPSPDDVRRELPLGPHAEAHVLRARETLQAILERRDPRLFAVVGPCSVHDVAAARDYATRLHALAERIAGTLFLVMRVYFEKPRTTLGWKGLINDPDLDDSFHIEKGIRLARGLLLELAEQGLPAATETLDPIMPQYLSELVSWSAIGARTTESQTHREMASGLSMPVGIKNGTDGSLDVAIDALRAVRHPHHFLGITSAGDLAVFRTRGNPHAHVVLRGGGGRTNYDAASVARCEAALAAAELTPNLVIDCSHGNSGKDPARQPDVARDCVDQILAGNRSIVGLMLESHLHAGQQPIPEDLSQLRYGVSVTDACMGWEETEALLVETDERLRAAGRLGARVAPTS